MPRSEARLQFDIWEGLDGLSADARLLYCVLLTDRSVNHAGQGFVRVDRWEQFTALPLERIEKAMVELATEPHVVFDRTTGEFLIRTMIRRDGYADQPYLLKGALAVAKNVESRALRRVLAAELRKLPGQKPAGVSKSGHPIVYPDPHACADEIDPGGPDPQDPQGSRPQHPVDTHSKGSPVGLGTQPEVTAEPVDLTPTQKGVETLGGGGGGGGGGSFPAATQDRIKESLSRVREKSHLIPDVRAAYAIGETVPRGIGRGTRSDLTMRIKHRYEDGIDDEPVVTGLIRWADNDQAPAGAIEWMIDDAVKAIRNRENGTVSLSAFKAAKQSTTDKRVGENAQFLAGLFGHDDTSSTSHSPTKQLPGSSA